MLAAGFLRSGDAGDQAKVVDVVNGRQGIGDGLERSAGIFARDGAADCIRRTRTARPLFFNRARLRLVRRLQTAAPCITSKNFSSGGFNPRGAWEALEQFGKLRQGGCAFFGGHGKGSRAPLPMPDFLSSGIGGVPNKKGRISDTSHCRHDQAPLKERYRHAPSLGRCLQRCLSLKFGRIRNGQQPRTTRN